MNCGLSDQVLSRMFETVTRPGRYLDHETNLRRDPGGRVRFLLCFPDLYEIGMSNLGIRILHHVINRSPEYRADLAFAPWPDMEAFMRQERIPLCGTGTGLRARDFDVLGFSLQHELQYTNVLNMLDLASVPLLGSERDDADPIVIAGGPCAFNPGPMSAFIDAFAIGDGESLCLEIADRLGDAKARGLARGAKLRALSEIEGVFVPAISVAEGQPGTVSRRVEAALRDEDFPLPPIVPIIPITHDRLTLEIMRGCTRGCRFCSAGMLTRPVRRRTVDSVVGLAQAGIEASGWEEVSLVSLSTSDYADLEDLVGKLSGVLAGRQVGISLPSMRPGTFTAEVARTISRTRKTGLTFAPEAGTPALRRRINKDIDEGRLYSTIETAFRGGWDAVKLYFMIGLPGEDDADVEGIVEMVKSVAAICRGFGKRRHATVSLSPFVPRAHTPLQWEAQSAPDEVLRRIGLIRRALPSDRIKLRWRDPCMSLVEGVLARGDRRCGQAVLGAWKQGARFDGWTDRFDFDLWTRCFAEAGVETAQATGRRAVGEPLPWSHIFGGVTSRFLRDEAEKAAEGVLTPDCREGACSECGACPGPQAQSGGKMAPEAALAARSPEEGSGAARVRAPEPRSFRDSTRSKRPAPAMRLRIRYAKGDELRFVSHLDVARAFQRSLRRARLPVVYSEGFSPHPRMSFGPPLPLGVAGGGEFLDVSVENKPGQGWMDALNAALPPGLRTLDARMIPAQGPSLISLLNAAKYRIVVWECDPQACSAVVESLRQALGAGLSDAAWAARGECGGAFDVRLTARLKLDSGASEKVIERVLRQAGRPFKLERIGLYVEREGMLYSPFGELEKG